MGKEITYRTTIRDEETRRHRARAISSKQTMIRLNRRILYVWTIYVLLLAIAAWGALYVLWSGFDPVSTTGTTAIVLFSGSGLIYSWFRYRSWDVAIRDEELLLQRGVLRKKKTFVPYKQIQHIDVEARPLERLFGLSRLVIHTAGSPHSSLVVPGLTASDASALKGSCQGGSDDGR